MTSPRDALLARNKRRIKKSEINVGTASDPAYFHWRNLSEQEKSAFEAAGHNKDGTPNRVARQFLRVRVIIAAAVTPEGELEYSDTDMAALKDVDGLPIQELADEAMAHIGWTKSDVEEMAKQEQALKNSPATPDDASPTS